MRFSCGRGLLQLFLPLLLLGGCSRLHAASDAPTDWSLTGEYALVEEVLLGWDDSLPGFYREMLLAAAPESRVTLIVDSASDFDLLWSVVDEVEEQLGASAHRIEVLELSNDSIWLRDYGPLITRSGGKKRVVDLEYWGGGADDAVASVLAEEYLQLPPQSVELELEGGNLLADGEGHCLVSTQVLVANPDQSEEEIRKTLRTVFGCEQTEILPPALDEPTGRVDMYATFTGPGELLLGKFDESADPAAREQLEEIATALAKRGYRVRRVPMPDQSDTRFRSYTNALAVNGAVLVPAYGSKSKDFELALEVFAEAYPGRAIEPIEASEIIELEGAVHCAAMTVPR